MFTVNFDYEIPLDQEKVTTFNPFDFDHFDSDEEQEAEEIYDVEYILENARIFRNFIQPETSEIFWNEFLFVGTKLMLYYEDKGDAGTPKDSQVIAQRIMEKKGEPFKCLDDIYPCFACSLQSPTYEILNNILKHCKSMQTFEDLYQACSKTYYVDRVEHRAKPLLHLLSKN